MASPKCIQIGSQTCSLREKPVARCYIPRKGLDYTEVFCGVEEITPFFFLFISQIPKG